MKLGLSDGTKRFVGIQPNKGLTGFAQVGTQMTMAFFTGYGIRRAYDAWYTSQIRRQAGDGVMFWGALGIALLLGKVTGAVPLYSGAAGAVGAIFDLSAATKFGANANLAQQLEDVANGKDKSATFGVDDSFLAFCAKTLIDPVNESLKAEGIRHPANGEQVEINPNDLIPFLRKGCASGNVRAIAA